MLTLSIGHLQIDLMQHAEVLSAGRPPAVWIFRPIFKFILIMLIFGFKIDRANALK